MKPSAVLVPLLLTFCLTPTFAQVAGLGAPYLDDRSTPASVVRSLYSAVNREEYARAYGYWQAGAKGLPPYKRFVAGYEDTTSITLSLGPTVNEGAAGSIYSTVPVRLHVAQRGGLTRTFLGCYTLRLTQPALQEPPFQSIEIVAGQLKPARQGASKPTRALCADAP